MEIRFDPSVSNTDPSPTVPPKGGTPANDTIPVGKPQKPPIGEKPPYVMPEPDADHVAYNVNSNKVMPQLPEEPQYIATLELAGRPVLVAAPPKAEVRMLERKPSIDGLEQIQMVKPDLNSKMLTATLTFADYEATKNEVRNILKENGIEIPEGQSAADYVKEQGIKLTQGAINAVLFAMVNAGMLEVLEEENPRNIDTIMQDIGIEKM